MLPNFAASRHYLYAKCAYLYLQQMQEISISHPDVYQLFKGGYNVVRRSDKFSAGICTDLIIEQELIEVNGRVVTRSWNDRVATYQMATLNNGDFSVNHSMETFTAVHHQSSEQHTAPHKECSVPRISRDYEDAMKMIRYLDVQNPDLH